MPSIIGTSTLAGKTFAFTGPNGNTGPAGAIGARGQTGITYGPTGSTGSYILDTVSDLVNGSIKFSLFAGSTFTFYGFTGPGISFSNSKATDSSSDTSFYSVLLGVCGGLTFSLRGICGDGTKVVPSLSSDGTEILLSINSPSLTVSYGVTADDFLTYSSSSYSITDTKIKVMGQLLEDTAAGFTGNTNRDSVYLELGLTSGSTPVSSVRVFSDFVDPFIAIPALQRGISGGVTFDGVVSIDSGGYILDLDRSSVFKISTPIGITAFNRKLSSNSNDSWLLFVEGADVWNLPSNLYFESGITGINQIAFCSGMNLLKIESDYTNNRYLGYFVDRCFGSSNYRTYGSVGACCYSGGCKDYVTEEVCTSVYGGEFLPLSSCKESCNIGSCCVNGICVDNVSKDLCSKLYGGSDIGWSSSYCISPGFPCTPGSHYYSIEKVNPQDLVHVTNIGTPGTQRQEVLSFKVTTSDPTAYLSATGYVQNWDDGVINRTLSTYDGITFGQDLFNGIIHRNMGEPVYNKGFTLYYNNSSDTIQGNVDYDTFTPTEYSIYLRKSTGEVAAGITYNIKPKFIEKCAGTVGSTRIKTAFTLTRFCEDCYDFDENNHPIFYPIQTQNGTFDCCVNSAGVIVPLCVTTTGVSHINDCKITAANNTYNPITGEDSIDPESCPHVEHLFVGSTTVPADPDPLANCNYAVTRLVPPRSVNYIWKGGTETVEPKGISGSPYYYEVSFYPDDRSIQNQLRYAGISASPGTIIQNIKSTIKSLTYSGSDVFFTQNRQNIGITLNNSLDSPCCRFEEYENPSNPMGSSSKTVLIPLDWSNPDPKTSEIRHFIVDLGRNGSFGSRCRCSSQGGGKITGDACSGGNITTSSNIRWSEMIVKCQINKANGEITGILDSFTPGCVEIVYDTYSEYTRCIYPTDGCTDDFNGDSNPVNYYGIKKEIKRGIDTDNNENAIMTTQKDVLWCGGPISCGCFGEINRAVVNSSNLTDISETKKIILDTQIKEYLYKRLFCGCRKDEYVVKCSPKSCSIPYEVCGDGNILVYPHDCGSSTADTINYVFTLEKTTNTTHIIITPKVYIINGATVTLTNEPVFYHRGYMSSDPNDTTDPFILTTGQSGVPIYIPKSVDTTNVTLYAYYTPGLNTDSDFYGSSGPLLLTKKIDLENTSAPLVSVYKRSTEGKMTASTGREFQAWTNEVGVSPNIISSLKSNGWTIDRYQIALHTRKCQEQADTLVCRGGECAPSEATWSKFTQNFLEGNAINTTFGPYPITSYLLDCVTTPCIQPQTILCPGWVENSKVFYYGIVTLSIYKTTDPSIKRVVEYNQKFWLNSPINVSSLPEAVTPVLTNKLLTAEDGTTQCVQINCQEFADCSLLPDC